MYARVFLVASLLASFVAAVDIPGLPKCAGDCVGTNFGGCQRLNVQCICSNNKLLTHLACCVSKNCDKSDQDKTIQFANAICQGQGVTDLPQSATCASTATGSSATASSNSSGTMTSSGAMTTGAGAQTTGTSSSASASASSSQNVAAPYEKAGGVGIGMIVAGLVAAI